MDTNFVEELLQKATEDEEKANQSVRVDKPIDLFYDLRHLLAVDTNPIDAKELRSGKEVYMKSLARDNCQLICNKLWQLETKRVDDTIVAQLPAVGYLLPRSKPIPKPKAPTKWETYAKMKGIQNKKKDKLVWDEESKQWKPRFGYRGINQQKDWVIEVPNNADPNVNYFEKRSEDKKERIAKNELQRLRNIARSQKVKVAGNTGIVPHMNQPQESLKRASILAKQSTASVGRFAEKLDNEKAPKNSGKRRHFEPNLGDMSREKDKNLKIIEDIMNKKPKLDINKAIEPMVKERNTSNKSKPDFKGKNRPKFDKRSKNRDNKHNNNNNNNNKQNVNHVKKSNKFGANGKHRKK
ncbi:ribosome biogenesis regulatory protein homolog [Oppia nitens]|uniref:ribosome biogenesis regulatory protein homolog n=1 Tax=Oppia nitens TaxID=1686743 RepID=UPI0023DC136E|nr:ribosome biogenesis regulatory protein homolog [Oppia nitens]